MIRVSMEVRQGTALTRATVEAESIREAVSITRGRYPDRDVRVMFPIDPEDFFIEGPAKLEQSRAEGNCGMRLSAGRRFIDKEELDGRGGIHLFEWRGEQEDA
jgi:hypothetical protein